MNWKSIETLEVAERELWVAWSRLLGGPFPMTGQHRIDYLTGANFTHWLKLEAPEEAE